MEPASKEIKVGGTDTVIMETNRRSLGVNLVDWDEIKHLVSNIKPIDKNISRAYSTLFTLGLAAISAALSGATAGTHDITGYLYVFGICFMVSGVVIYFTMGKSDQNIFEKSVSDVTHYMTEVIEKKFKLENTQSTPISFTPWEVSTDDRKQITVFHTSTQQINFTIKSKSPYWRAGFTLISDSGKELLDVHLGRDEDGKLLLRILEEGKDQLDGKTPPITVTNIESISFLLTKDNEDVLDVYIDGIKRFHASNRYTGSLLLRAWGDKRQFNVQFTDISAIQ